MELFKVKNKGLSKKEYRHLKQGKNINSFHIVIERIF